MVNRRKENFNANLKNRIEHDDAEKKKVLFSNLFKAKMMGDHKFLNLVGDKVSESENKFPKFIPTILAGGLTCVGMAIGIIAPAGAVGESKPKKSSRKRSGKSSSRAA